jgi:hypothetical protein
MNTLARSRFSRSKSCASPDSLTISTIPAHTNVTGLGISRSGDVC